MTEKNINNLESIMKQRLYEISKFWDELSNSYHNSNDFIPNLNALIQALRNITFIAQSYKSIIPDFEEWYESKREEMRNDEKLKWAHDSRNLIVKSDNLKLKSRTTIELVNWRDYQYKTILEDPLTKNEEIIKFAISDLSRKDLLEILKDPLIRVNRSWVADNLPDFELLSLTSYVYVYFKSLVFDLFEKVGLNNSVLMNDFEKNNLITSKSSLFDDDRTIILSLKDGHRLSRHKTRVYKDPKIEKKVKKRYSISEENMILPNSKFPDKFEVIAKNAKRALLVDGFHMPMIFLFKGDEIDSFIPFLVADRSELYYAVRKFSDDIKKQKISGVILITEMWNKDLNCEIKGESIGIAAITKDFFEMRFIDFERKGKKVILGKEYSIKERKDMFFLSSIFKAIEESS